MGCALKATPVQVSLSTAGATFTASAPRPETPVEALPTASSIPPTFTPVPQPSATVPPSPASTPKPGQITAQLLAQTNLANRDLNELARRFNVEHADSGAGVPADAQNRFLPGATDTFWVFDSGAEPPAKFQSTARLLHVSDHAYWWVEEGFDIPEADIIASAQQFETKTYPTNHHFFGSEWLPGIDGDVRVHILMGNIPGVAGYFSSSNEYSRYAVEHSNQREMFLLNLNAIRPGSSQFDGVLAHEFQHMIHWHQDSNEDSWINEGLSELAEFVNGFGISTFTNAYLSRPDTQLTSWGRDSRTQRVNYGASFLFALYLYDKLGAEMVQTLVLEPNDGIAGVDAALQQINAPETFETLFAGFVVANYVNDPAAANGKWGYVSPEVTLLPMFTEESHRNFPVEKSATVHQYGVDYIEILNGSPLSLNFSGAITNTLLNNRAHSGEHQWYSNRGDSSDVTLTRAFDLSGLTDATLTFRAWYDIEADWDYAYVTVSADWGETWDILPATGSVNTNPVGNAFGPGFTGVSGDSTPEWREETVDLTPYAGQNILLRFEVITDDAVNLPGFAVDDIAIPQLGFSDDAEHGMGDWQANGFILTDNILPQRFMVQLIEYDSDGKPTVTPLRLDDANRGQVMLDGSDSGSVVRSVLVVSALAPTTTNAAEYTYSITAP